MATIEPRGRIVPVLLSGGAGSRLWPLSRETYPKQLLSLLGENTLLQQTALRVDDRLLFTEPLVLANAEHRFAIGEQLRAVGVADPTIVLEPCGRNTAPAVAVAALLASERDPDALILVMPVDHWVRDRAAFRTAISAGIKGARYGRFVLFGVRPSGPETGFGYIRMGSELEAASPIRNVAGFVEKPDLVVVERLLACDEHLWNSGIFLLPARRFIDELAHCEPDVLAACRNALAGATRDLDFLRLDAQAFEACPSISIDYAIMEKTDNAVVVPATFDWSDVGSWSALWSMADKDPSGNVVIGDALMEDASGCYVRGDDGQLVAALGVEDLIIAASPDVVLVTSRKRDQDVGRLVERLKANGHRSATQTRSVHRPWGYYQSIHAGERFQVKRITVNPGAKLSLQKHYHRAEHWVVVNGTAIVTRDDEEILLRENESIFVPLGCTHRLENPGKVPLNLIEIQSGSYLGEDDIVRMQDIYDRV